MRRAVPLVEAADVGLEGGHHRGAHEGVLGAATVGSMEAVLAESALASTAVDSW